MNLCDLRRSERIELERAFMQVGTNTQEHLLRCATKTSVTSANLQSDSNSAATSTAQTIHRRRYSRFRRHLPSGERSWELTRYLDLCWRCEAPDWEESGWT